MEMASEATLKKLAASAQTTNVRALAQKALALQTADKFRLAAMLLDLNKVDMAEAIGTRACQEIQLAQLFGTPGKRP